MLTTEQNLYQHLRVSLHNKANEARFRPYTLNNRASDADITTPNLQLMTYLRDSKRGAQRIGSDSGG